MAKPKPRASAPPRPIGNIPEQKAKFYDGPTISGADKARRKSAPSAQQAAYKPAPSPSAVAPASVPIKRTTNIPEEQLQVVKVKKRKRRNGGFSLWGMITLLPLLVFASLFSTILCPPPTAQPSTFSSMALGTLGLRVQPAESSLHKTLCYPANVYYDEVLVHYVYPAIEDAKAKIASTPFYQDTFEPTYQKARAHALKIWNGPVKPVVDRTCRGAQIVHRTYVAPHVPYVKAKFTEATAPLRARACALYKTHLAPHVKVAKKHGCTAVKNSKATYSQIAAHPATKQAGKHAHCAYLYSRKQGARAYEYSKPHAIWAYNEGKRHTHETVIPRTIQGLSYAGKQACSTWSLIKAEWAKFYAQHLAVHCDPYLAKANEVLGPVCATVNKQVYVPFVQPVVHSVFPPSDKPRNLWSYAAQFVPVAGSTVGQRGGESVKKAATDVKKGVKQAAADAEKKAAEAKRAAEEKAAAVKKAAEDKAAAAKKAAEDKAAEVKRVAEAKRAEAKKAAEEKEAALKKEAEKEAAEAAAIEAEIAANAKAAFKKAEASRAAASDTDDLTRQAFVAPTESVAPSAKTGTSSDGAVTGATDLPKTAAAACDSTTGAGAAAAKESATDAEGSDHVADARAQIQRLKKKVDFQGKALFAKVQAETVAQAEHFLDLIPEMKAIGDDNLDREITRMFGGLDRLYSNSRTLTRDQVEESQRMSDEKVLKVLEQVTNGVKTKKNHIYEKTQPAVENAQAEIERVLGDDYAALGKRMSLMEGITAKDWTLYKALKKDVADWKSKLAEAPEKNHSKRLKDIMQQAQAGAAELITDFTDSYAGWKARQEQLRKQALDRIIAREAVDAESKVKRATQAKIVVPKKAEDKKAGTKGSILDIKEKEQEKKTAGSPLLAKVDKQAEDAKAKSAKDEL